MTRAFPAIPPQYFALYDMHSGGTAQTEYETIIFEARDEEDACRGFTRRFGTDPRDTSCDCCGADYRIDGPYTTLEDACEYGIAENGSLAAFLGRADVCLFRTTVRTEE